MFGIAWVITSGSLLELHAINPNANSTVELIVLTFANLLATVLRFVLFRVWVFRDQRRPTRRHSRRATTLSGDAHDRSADPHDQKAVTAS